MNQTILDNLPALQKLDSQNMLGSLQLLGKQIEQSLREARRVRIPASYKNIQNIVVLGMGGSTLGAHLIKTLFFDKLKVPLDIINGYHVPNFVGRQSLVVVSSYSGTTEEPLAAMPEARRRGARLLVITSGGALAKEAKRLKLPALIFTTQNNPCHSPRMGLGYMVVGQLALLAKVGILSIRPADYQQLLSAIKRAEQRFGVATALINNRAKQLAIKIQSRSVWWVAAEHLGGNAHIAANQTNETAKRFGGYWLIPEINHHLMEGMMRPTGNRATLLFILIESSAYDPRVQKRFLITRKVLDKNRIRYVRYQCQEKTKLAQAGEVLVLGSYASYYSALLQGIDPTAIPLVDYFKEQLKR